MDCGDLPQLIEKWQAIYQSRSSGSFADKVAEQLRAQLEVASTIMAADGDLATTDEQVRETLAWSGAQDEGRVAEQFHLEREIDPAEEGTEAD